MIKAEVVKTSESTIVYFETRDTSPEGLEELDMAYQVLMGSEPKRGGYMDSNKFNIEIKDPS